MDIVTLQAARAAAKKELNVKSRRAVYATGTNGTTSTYTNSGGVGSLRLVFKLPVTPTRFRIKIRNYNTVTGSNQFAVTGKGLSVGQHQSANDGYETGNVAGSLTSLSSSDFSIPFDGSWWTSSWFVPSTYQLTNASQYILAFGYDAGGAATFVRGVGQAWHATDLSLLTGSTSAPGTPMANTPMEFQIEYEWSGAQRVGLFIGDSITEGLGGQSSLGNLPFYSWPYIWAARNNAVAINAGVSGATAGNWAGGTTGRYWTRLDLNNMVPDFVVIGLGANDANNSTTLATYQSNMLSITSSVRSLYGEVPIYTSNVTPRGLETSVKEPLRISYNNWLENLPMRTVSCIDMDAAVRDAAVPTQILGATTANNIYNYDGTHFTRRGYNKMALAVGRL